MTQPDPPWPRTAVVSEVPPRGCADVVDRSARPSLLASDPATTDALAPDTAAWLASGHGP